MADFSPRRPFAEVFFEYQEALGNFEEALCEAGAGAFEKLGGDWYDGSLEMYGVDNGLRLTPDQQKLIFDAGFVKVYVNHKDEWQTHYTWGRSFTPQRGWRRRYVKDSAVTTTNVIAGPANPGYYEISYWPEGWDNQRDWLENGYMRIVPDPLDRGADSV